jgi:nucleotide-binding universal stress UspA family protein
LHQSSNRVLHSHTPPEWMPPAIAKHELLDKFVTPPRFLEIVTDLGPGDAIVEWLERSEIDRPDVVLLGALRCVGVRVRCACARMLTVTCVFVFCCVRAGSRGFTGLRRFLLGSVSSYIMETEVAPCLVVRSSLPRRAVWGGEGAQEEAREEGGPSEVPATAAAAAPPPPPPPTPSARGRVVGIAVDGTPEGTTALVQWARQFVLRPDDRVTILHGRPDKPKARCICVRTCADACCAACNPLTRTRIFPASRRMMSWKRWIAPSKP